MERKVKNVLQAIIILAMVASFAWLIKEIFIMIVDFLFGMFPQLK